MTVPVRVLDTAIGDRTLVAADLVALNPAFTGGSINGMPVGGVTPASGAFTSLSATGDLNVGGQSIKSVQNAITAGTTQTLAGSVPITKQVAVISVCAHANDGVALPAAAVGLDIIIFNNGANPAKVWPQVADAVDGGTAGVAVVLTNALRCRFICNVAGNWISAQLGAVSG